MSVTLTVSPLFTLSGLGMIAVGASSMIYWKVRKRASIWWFLFGGIVWALVIAAKAVMDITVSGDIFRRLASSYASVGTIIVWGMVVGLRTGYLECGLTYIACIGSKLKRADFSSAVAFGIGFGAAEAIVIGFMSLMNILMLVISPELINLAPPQQKELLVQQFSMGFAIIPAPIVERFFTLLAHVFSAVLIIYAVQTEKAEYFLASFAYKSLLDGMIPWLNKYIGFGTLSNIYTIELIVAIYGIVGLLGTVFLSRRFGKPVKPGLSFRKAGAILLMLFLIMIFIVLNPLYAMKR